MQSHVFFIGQLRRSEANGAGGDGSEITLLETSGLACAFCAFRDVALVLVGGATIVCATMVAGKRFVIPPPSSLSDGTGEYTRGILFLN